MISRPELVDLGASRAAIRHRVDSGTLRLLHRGVFLVASNPITDRARMLAAALACGVGAVVSGTTAAVLWCLVPKHLMDGFHVIVSRQVRPPAGITVHRRALDPSERTHHFGVPVTTPARTLLDIAPLVSARRLSRAIRQAEVDGLVKHDALVELARSSRPGAPALRAALAPGSTPTRSGYEDDVADLLRGPGAPGFETNARVFGHEVDVWVPSLNLAIEVDGGRWHDTPQARHEDAVKQAALEAAGVKVTRLGSD